MKICVLGNGPDLAEQNIPDDIDITIGVNRSYEVEDSDYLVTTDARAWAKIMKDEPPGMYVIGGAAEKVRRRGKHRLVMSLDTGQARSGCAALELAYLLQPDEVYLLGFGGRGHFYDKNDGANDGLEMALKVPHGSSKRFVFQNMTWTPQDD